MTRHTDEGFLHINIIANSLCALLLCLGISGCDSNKIDRHALVTRNNPTIFAPDTLSSFSVGNGEFAMTVDATGLQTFPGDYSNGVPLGTMSQWGWHSFPNTERYAPVEALADFDFGRGRLEPYATQFRDGRQCDASNWLRANPHRLHLGSLGLLLPDTATLAGLTNVHQTLNLWAGVINSQFTSCGINYKVSTICHPDQDVIATHIQSDAAHVGVRLRFPYPTGGHSDDACCWDNDAPHSTSIVAQTDNGVILKRKVDSTIYYVGLSWEGTDVHLEQSGKNSLRIASNGTSMKVTCKFATSIIGNEEAQNLPTFKDIEDLAQKHWQKFWTTGAAVDFGLCTDARAKELERRVVLSQYLLAIQCAGSTPPQETGLTYNSWFGKFHLEMIWWHQSWLPLWGHSELLDRTMGWYADVEPIAHDIAARQGFAGVRWMKMTDPSGMEAPSKVGSFLIWQQPHYIYLAELLYRAHPTHEQLVKHFDLVQKTAEFMASFVTYEPEANRYVLQGVIPAQETLRAAETVNPPFELSYWHFALQVAQTWRERAGLPRVEQWDNIIARLSRLAHNDMGLYLAAETATETYNDKRFTSDHMAVLGAVGILPTNPLVCDEYMKRTFNWIWDNWSWDKTWGWDYPMTAMNATRMGQPAKAVDALLMDQPKNTYLPNGHNFQDVRLRCYLPGNGGLLTAISLMCAGWDGCEEANPGFPHDGTWDVRWEGLSPMP